MASVEERVVRMTFENAAFEKKVATTLGTIGTLNSAIANVGTKNGLDQLAAADKGFTFGGMTSAIQGVSASFAAMATIGITALANITNRAVDAGLSLGKSLTLEPITDGFAEYELNMNSIQTVLANTKKDGTNLQDVNKALDGLNEYSDLTIYNFAQMAKNIGSATAAGVDLDTATSYVKGFANSAAVAGVDAGAMAGGLEQMSQALGSGVIKAQDWISLEKRGLAGQVQQQAFFDMAKAMGTLADVPADQSFEEWTEAGNTLRGSLKDGWLTAEVFTNTMGVFAGEMDEAKLASLGFTEEMIPGAIELGETAVDAATKVRTLSQLMDTTQEAVASGWMESFRTVVGDFEEATDLFTNISNKTGEIIGRSAERRNKLLTEWKQLGGRADLIEGFRASFSALGNIISLVKGAFRGIFPRKSAEDWARYTEVFKNMALRLEELTEQGLKLQGPFGTMRVIFSQVFRMLKNIGSVIWAVVSGFAGMVKELVPLGGGKVLEGVRDFLSFIADALGNIDTGKITDFFENLTGLIQGIIPIFAEGYDAIREFIEGLDFSGVGNFFSSIVDSAAGVSFDTSVFDKFADTVGGAFDNLRTRISYFGEIFGFLGDVWSGFVSGLSAVGGFISDAAGALSDFFGQLTGGVEESVEKSTEGNYDKLFDTLAVVFFGGLAAGFVRFLNKGFDFNFDFGGGVFEQLSKTLGNVNGVLKGMQADLKATALLKIAAAIGVLALSITLLSFIDPEKLAVSMAAIAVGFGQLAGALAILNKIEFTVADTAKFTLMALSFGILAGSLVLLGIAMKIYATMGWEEIAKGSAVLGLVITAIIVMSKNLEDEAKGMIKASTAMLLMSLSMGSMYKVIKKFGELDTEVMVQGFIGVAAAMGFLVATMRFLPTDLEKRTAGMLGFSIALNLMVVAIKILGAMDLGELVQGGVAFAGMLGIIVLALNKMPKTMGVQAAQLLALGGAILVMSIALKAFGTMDWDEIGRGLAAMAGSLILLVLAMNLASGGVIGAGAMLIMSASMLVLAAAIRAFAGLGFKEFAKGMLLMAGGLAVIAGVAFLLTPAIPALLGLGLALGLLGIGIAAIGFGAAQVAKAILTLSKVGKEGAEALVDILEAVGKSLPALFKGFAEGLIEMAKMILGVLPELISGLSGVLTALIDLVIENLPKIGELFLALVDTLLEILTEAAPDIVQAGIDLLLGLLEGISNNIGDIVEVVADIIINFIGALEESLPDIVDAGVSLVVALLEGIGENFDEIAAAAVDLIDEFASAALDAVEGIAGVALDILVRILELVVDNFDEFVDAAADFMGNMFDALIDAIGDFSREARAFVGKLLDFLIDEFTAWVSMMTKLLRKWLGAIASAVTNVGRELRDGMSKIIYAMINEFTAWATALAYMLRKFLGAIGTAINSVSYNLRTAMTKVIYGMINEFTAWVTAAASLMRKFLGGIAGAISAVSYNLRKGMEAILDGMINSGVNWAKFGIDTVIKLFNGIRDAANYRSGAIGTAAGQAAGAIINRVGAESWGFISSVASELGGALWDAIWNAAKSAGGTLFGWAVKAADVVTPGRSIGSGLGDAAGNTFVQSFGRAIDQGTAQLSMDPSFNPKIRPVMDMTQARAQSTSFMDYLQSSQVSIGTSINQASSIAMEAEARRASVTDHATKSSDVYFEQIINAPKQLSTGDIYRQTRNQITMAKEELRIP